MSVGESPHLQPEAIRVVLADSTRMGNQLLSGALSRDRHFKVMEVAVSSQELMRAIRLHDPDVTVVAAELERTGGGTEATQVLLTAHPDARVVILVDELDREKVVDAFRSGAKGVFGRDEPVATLVKCIRCVHNGQVWGSSREFQFVLEALRKSRPPTPLFANQGVSLLSEREQQVVRSVCEGLNNRDIAHRLQLSEHTVKNHLFRIYSKLGVTSRIEIMFSALAQRILEPPRTPEELLSDPERFECCRKQAEYFPLAQLALGRMYVEGRGTERDVVTGYRWLTLAEEGAHEIIEHCNAIKEKAAAEVKPDQRPQPDVKLSSEHLNSGKNRLAETHVVRRAAVRSHHDIPGAVQGKAS